MAVGKRLRFQIFRRDNFSCRYCGATAQAGAVLEVDHVKPRADGGQDVPTNLITACEGCNSGKSDIPLNAPVVEDVPQAEFDRALAEREAAKDEDDDEAELADWVHDLEISSAVRFYSGFDEIPHPLVTGRFIVSFAFAVAEGVPNEDILSASEAAGLARNPNLFDFLDLPEEKEEPEEEIAYLEAVEYLRAFIPSEQTRMIWRARKAAGNYQPTHRELVRAAAGMARSYIEDPGRDTEALEEWLRRLPNGAGSLFLLEATADWDAHWKGHARHSAWECRDEVLDLAVSLALGAEVPV